MLMMPMTSAYLLIKYIGTIHVDDGLLSQTKVLLEKYTKTSKSADFGTKQNTADFEIRRLQVTTRLDMLFSSTVPE